MVQIEEDFMTMFSRNEEMIIFLYLLLNSNKDGVTPYTLRRLSNDCRIEYGVVKPALDMLVYRGLIAMDDAYLKVLNIGRYRSRKTSKRSEADKVEDERERVFAKRMEECYPNVAKMKKPLTRGEWDKLIIRGYTKEQLTATLDNMDNCKELNKKYVYAYKTLVNWLKIEHGDK